MEIKVKLEKIINKVLFEYNPAQMSKMEFLNFMPSIGDTITFDNKEYKVTKINRIHKSTHDMYGERVKLESIDIIVREVSNLH